MFAASWRTGVAAVLGYLFLAPSDASAKIMLITTGNTISHLGPVQTPPPAASGRSRFGMNEATPESVLRQVGYKYDYGGLFWIDFWTWGGEYCLYDGDKTYHPITPEEAARFLGRTDPPSRPFLFKFPLGLLILGGILVLGIIGAIFNKKEPTGQTDADDTDLDQYRRSSKE